MRITIDGELRRGVTPKDVALVYHIISLLRLVLLVTLLNMLVMFLNALSMEGRMTVCNLSIEMGARGGMIAPDEKTFEYIKRSRVYT